MSNSPAIEVTALALGLEHHDLDASERFSAHRVCDLAFDFSRIDRGRKQQEQNSIAQRQHRSLKQAAIDPQQIERCRILRLQHRAPGARPRASDLGPQSSCRLRFSPRAESELLAASSTSRASGLRPEVRRSDARCYTFSSSILGACPEFVPQCLKPKCPPRGLVSSAKPIVRVYDREAVYRILDEGFLCHVGFASTDSRS